MAREKKVQDGIIENEGVVTKTPKTTKKATTKSKDVAIEKNSLEKENKELRNEIDELKAMMMKLMNNQSSKQEEVKDIKIDELEIQEEYEEIDLKKLINVTNLFDGALTLFGLNNTPIPFSGFGVTRPLTYENIIQVVGNYNKWAKAGLFYIHDKKAVRSQMLEEDYKNCLTKDEIINFINNSESKIKEILPKISPEIQETIKYIVARGINSTDNRYLDRNKIATIGEILKVDLRDFAEALRF